jgi:hypothetical protein
MKFAIIFKNSFGKFATIIEAETAKEAITKSLKCDSVREIESIEAIQIIF